jgi:hypothetical protein
MADQTPPTPVSSTPGDDQPVGPDENGTVTVLKAIREYKKEAEDARRTRMKINADNRRAYLGVQDWSHKNKGQSKEFLPKTPVAVEQFVGFAKRALTQFGSYFDVELGKDSKSPLSGESIRKLLMGILDDILVDDNKTTSFPVLLSDTLKVGALESLCILKVHGNMRSHRTFRVEAGDQLVANESQQWKLRVDLVKPENYFPDPTGSGLYEIHSVERDLHYLKKRAEEGFYDERAVNRIEEDYRSRPDQDRKPSDQAQDEAQKPSFRKRVRIDEFWGTIVDADGNIVHENVFCAMANNKYLIRRPTPNPFWHQESPFVAVPLIRVPFSVWHKALFDHASQLNYAANEIFNLIIDGGISSVWGIKQLRIDDLEDPRSVSDGIAQGDTLVVKSTLPHNAKVLETATEGQVPTDAMAVLEMLSREFAAASLTNELKMGNLPGKQVKATEIVELSQSQAVTLDAIVGDIERLLIGKTLRKIWLTILQNIDDINSQMIADAIGIGGAFTLSRMSPAERFAVFSSSCSFKVNGLSAVLSKVRDFQKIMALLQSISTNPLLLQAFFKKYSPDKLLAHIMKTLAVNPDQMYRDEQEMSKIQSDLQTLPAFQALTSGANTGGGGGQGGAGMSAQTVGEPELPAEISAVSNPTSGLAGIGGS